MKLLSAALIGVLFLYGSPIIKFGSDLVRLSVPSGISPATDITQVPDASGIASVTTVDDVVIKANALKLLLTTAQVNTLQQTFTTTLAKKWSNLPCGSMCRNGIQFSTLTTAQLDAAKAVIQAASGTAANEGYDEFIQIITADSLLGTVGGSGYSKGIYFLSFLNAPTTSGPWMLQFGGHHYAANIAFNNGKVVGTTPTFEGVEPKVFTTQGGTVIAPINQERAGMVAMLASLTTAQLAAAKLTTTFSDVLLGPNQDGNFPATKQGLAVSTLTSAQKAMIVAAMKPWLADADDASGAALLAVYQNEIESAYIAYSSNNSAVAGDSSSFLTTNTDYVRIDGTSVWIEFVCQTGVVYPSQIHYHTVYRDHTRDYGNYLANTFLPLQLLHFNVTLQGTGRTVKWETTNEAGVSYFEIERSADASAGFASIGQVAARNETSNNYSFADNSQLNDETIFYRLKMIDQDGYSRYSQVVAVKNNQVKSTIALFPNPAKNVIGILLPQTVSNATIKIFNANGSNVLTATNQNGKNLNLDISRLPTGAYDLQVIEKGLHFSTSFVKQ